MRNTVLVLLCVLITGGLLGIAAPVAAQEEGHESILLYGPRVGVTYIMQSRDDFSEEMQSIFGGSQSYFPAFSDVGLAATHLIPLGETESYLAIEESLLLGGMDQQLLLPAVSLLVGVRTGFDSSLMLGPYVSTIGGSDGVELRFSLAYALSWSFEVRGITLPVKFAFVPWPTYAKPKMTLTTGIDFEVVR